MTSDQIPESNLQAALTTARPRLAWTALIAILVLAAILHFTALDRYPLPINQDELSNIYDGWSLAQMGTDRHGAPWPFVLRAFGSTDYRPALFAWLYSIPAHWTALSVSWGRAVSGVAGIFSIVLATIWARRTLSRPTALLLALMLSVTPWHLLFSRMAHEGTMLPCLFTVATILALRHAALSEPCVRTQGNYPNPYALAPRTLSEPCARAQDDSADPNTPLPSADAHTPPTRTQTSPFPWLLAGFIIGLSTSAYMATRLTAFLFFLVGLLILTISSIANLGSRHQALNPARSNKYRHGPSVSPDRARDSSQGLPAPGSQAHSGSSARRADERFKFRSSWLYAFALYALGAGIGAAPQLIAFAESPSTFLGRANTQVLHPDTWRQGLIDILISALKNLDPPYLFESFGNVNQLSVGRCLLITAPFFFLGLLALLWPKTKWSWIDRLLLLAGLIICITPSAITYDSPHALRASSCAAVIPMIAVVGIEQSRRWLARRFNPRAATLAMSALAFLILAEGLLYVGLYVTDDKLPHLSQQHGLVKLALWLKDHHEGYDRIYIEPQGEQMDLYIAAFTGMTPRDFYKAKRAFVEKCGFDRCIRLNQYYFASRYQALYEWQQAPKGQHWLLMSADREFLVELKN